MAGIGNWWVSSVQSKPGESVESSWYANYLRTEGRPLGGKLYLTSERLVFCPHLIDSFLGGDAWKIDLDRIHSVDPVRSNESGSPGDRLRVEFDEEEAASFVLNDLEVATGAIDEAVAARIESRSD